MPWHVLGRSVHGRKIAAAQSAIPRALRVAVVGCIDGDEWAASESSRRFSASTRRDWTLG
jgi:hypothetical protein